MSNPGKPQPVRLAARRAAKSPPTPMPTPAPVPVRAVLTLTFMVDGQPAGAAAFPVAFPCPSPEQVARLEVKLDARELLKLLEPALGPQKPGIWTPGPH